MLSTITDNSQIGSSMFPKLSLQFNKKKQSISNTITVISDPEGGDIYANLREEDHNNEIYICGDLIDSTAVLKSMTRIKNYNLQNIYRCITNPNIKVCLGNRDLNKFKCYYLCNLDETIQNDLVRQFNNGEINLTYDTYTELNKELNTQFTENNTEIDSKIWNNINMVNWYSFWTPNFPIHKYNPVNDKYINPNHKEYNPDIIKPIYNTQYKKNNIFKTRYDEIFGADPAIGTMSASYISTCIMNELTKLTKTNNEIYGNFRNYTINQIEDYAAFVTLAIFRSMNLNVDDLKKIANVTEIINTSDVKGWLHLLYTKNNICYSIQTKQNHLLFSHGGITNISLHDDNLENIFKMCKDLKENLVDGHKYFHNYCNKTSSQAGGFYTTHQSTNKNTYTSNQINKKIIFIQKYMRTKYTAMINERKYNNKKPSQLVLFFCMLTGYFDYYVFNSTNINKENNKKCDNEVKKYTDKKQKNIKYDMSFASPIMAGILNLRVRESLFTITDKELYQFFGHKPVGISTTVDLIKFVSETKKESKEPKEHYTTLVNLDISNTFTTTTLNPLTPSTIYNRVDIKQEPDGSDQILLNTDITLNIYKLDEQDKLNKQNKFFDGTDKQIFNISDETQPFIKNNNPKYYANKILYSADFGNKDPAFFVITITDLNISSTEFRNNIQKLSMQNIFYHGTTTQDNKLFHVFTYMDDPTNPTNFVKTIFILNQTDFDLVSEYITKLAQSVADKIYKEKYLKYKLKYNNLKNELGLNLKYDVNIN